MLSLPMNEAIQEMFKEVYIDLEFKVVELEALYTAWRAGEEPFFENSWIFISSYTLSPDSDKSFMKI